MGYFEEQLNSDDTTRELQQLISSISGWLDSNGFMNQQIRDRFANIDGLLEEKGRNVLFLAEFSRGKTELINTTIFGSTGQRLLPSTPGRTTRCTTVLKYDPEELPSLRLLPTIGPKEIQHQPISLIENNSPHWQRTLFSADDTESIINALHQVSETELVSPQVAQANGFVESAKESELDKIDVIHGNVAIPKYRHAIINFPHPLLKQGLSIIDTPGLNALGIEPELTLRSLETANAIVFIVSADTGVTRSELAAWNEHVKHHHIDNTLVVINKIDMLWDEIKSESEIKSSIKKQVSEVARVLEIPTSRVFPVSAQKSLVGRRDENSHLLRSSGIERFELALADTINFSNRMQIIDSIRSDVTTNLDVVARLMDQRVNASKQQIAEIQQLLDNQSKVSDDNILAVKKDREKLEKVTDELNSFRVDLKVEFDNFVEKLDIFALDRLIARYRLEISNQLTTSGLQREMNEFQLAAVDKFKSALVHITNLETKLFALFQNVENILETRGLKPRTIHPVVYLRTLEKYEEKHAKYTKGIGMLMTEQNALRDRYHASVMVKVRKLYIQTKDEVELWCKTVLTPLELELRDKSAHLKKRLLSLERVRKQDSGVLDELNLLQSRVQSLTQRKNTVNHFKKRLEQLSEDEKPVLSNVISMRERASAS